MTTIDKIRAEIERLEGLDYPLDTYEQSLGFYDALDRIKAFLDTLPDEPVMDCNDLEEAADEWCKTNNKGIALCADKKSHYLAEGIDAFIAGAEWQKAKILNDNPVIMSVEDFQALIDSHAKRVEADYKEQMMEGAVEGEVCGRVYDHINVRFADGVCKYLEPKNISHIPADVSKYNIGDKVKIIIVKEDEQ